MSFFVVRNGHFVTAADFGGTYNGDKIPGENDNWNTFSTVPNAFVKDSYGELCKRNLTLYHTFGAARACVNKPLSYIIGDGLRFKSAIKGELINWSKEQAVDWSKRFSHLLHYAKLDIGYYEKQAVIFRQALITGDAIVYFVRENNGKPFDIVVAGAYDINWQKEGKNITLGVQTDNFSRPTGIHKVDGKYVPFIDPSTGLQNCILFFLQETAGQLRGNGCFYSEIARAKGFDRVYDATIERMVMESTILGYFANDGMDGLEQLRRAAKQAAEKTVAQELTQEIGSSTKLMPGQMLQFNNQGSMKFTDLKTPSKNFGDANEYYLLLFSMSRGYPKPFISGQYNESYSAGRSVLNDSMKKVRMERSSYIRQVDNIVNLEFLKYFVREKLIEVPEGFETNTTIQRILLDGTHIGPEPEAINPLQESMANEKDVNNGFRLREAVALKNGTDWDCSKDEWKEQNEEYVQGSPEALMKKYERELEGNENN